MTRFTQIALGSFTGLVALGAAAPSFAHDYCYHPKCYSYCAPKSYSYCEPKVIYCEPKTYCEPKYTYCEKSYDHCYTPKQCYSYSYRYCK